MHPDAVDDLLGGEGEEGDADGPDGADSADDARVPHGSVDDPELLDFSANTNPSVPEGVQQVYRAALTTARSYPSEDYAAYRRAAAAFAGCDPARVVPTAGGLEAIRLAVATTVEAGGSALVPTPSFGEYAREVRLQGGEPTFRPHDELPAADPGDHDLAIVCNPNNPTGDAYDHARLRAFAERCRAADTLLLVDEAFIGFTDEPSLAGTEGVVVARSLTKLFGLPGLRAGFAVATGRHRERIEAVRPTWSLSEPARAVGTHCLDRSAFVARTRERVASERERLVERLGERFSVHPSDAPFLLLDAGSSEAADEALADAREADIALRDARTFRGLDSHLRVAVRLPAENDRLLSALGV